MFLKQLEIHGFKSFGERTRLGFGRGITAIVGPNGSGKSNIADGIRWVLGEQSARSLRGDTMQDIIFAGSDGKGPLGMASVSLTLGDCEGYLSLDFDEVTVTRRVYRSGESQYLINKSPCRLRDIRDLFLDTGLGREGYCLIGQGQIDAILLARPEERRLLIEEAAGIGKYRTRKAEATRKLASTEANLLRLDDIISELERQLDPLEKSADKAKIYLNLSQEYREKGQALCAYEWAELTQEGQQFTEKEAQLIASMTTLEEQQRHGETEIATLRQEMEKLEVQLENLQDLRTKSIQDIGEIQQQQAMTRERMKHAEADSKRLEGQLTEHENSRKKVRGDLASCLWRLRNLRRRRVEELQKIEGLVLTQSHRQSERQKLLDEVEKIGVTQESIRQVMAEIQKDLEASHSRKALWQEQITVLSHRLEEILAQKEVIGEDLLRREEVLLQARQELEAGRGSLTEHNRSQGELQTRWANQQELVRSWQEKLQGQTSRFQALAEMEKDYVGYYRGVKAVMQARKRLSGICGVVAELIGVPSGLEIAIETALGSSLQNIVTETDVGARQAVSYLKEKQAGRATFLPLDGLRATPFRSRDRDLLEEDGVVGIASELIEYEPRYQPMAQYLLGRVVITRDLDTAVGLSRSLRGYSRIVTLDGDTISPGGAITGGSLPQNEKSGLLQRRQQVSRLSKAIQISEATLEQEQQTAQSLAEDLRRTELEAKALAEQLHQTELHIKELEKEVALGRNEKTRWEREASQVLAEVEGLQARLTGETEKRQERLIRLNQLEEELTSWQKKLLAIQADLAILQKDQANTQQTYTASKVGIATLESEIQANEREVARYRASLDEIADLTAGTKHAQRTVELQKEGMQQDMEALAQKYRHLHAELGQIEEGLSRQSRQRKETQNQLLAREQASKVNQDARDSLQKDLADVTRALDKIALRKARLAETMEDDYGLQPNTVFSLPLPDGDIRKTRERIKTLKAQIQALGPVDTESIAQYDAVSERYSYLQEQQQDLVEAREQLTEVIGEMDSVCNVKFRETLTKVQKEFQMVFTKLFGGGAAELVLTAADELEEAGLDISVRPPGKKPQNMNLLSGGERALTAISLLFALLRVKPSPFCVLDEIDASLDESNLERFTELLKNFTRDTQFIVITHRPTTMEAADTLYGVTMNRVHISQLVSVQLDEAAAGFEDKPSGVR